MPQHAITRADILDRETYNSERPGRRQRITEIKRHRRLAVGPDATAYFESYDTMFHQIHEMLRIEGGGEDQIKDELSAYNPLIPKGKNLSCTLMFEIDDEQRRGRVLAALGGVENSVALIVGDDRIPARPGDDLERTTAAGKTSSIHFLLFDLTADQIAAFRADGARVALEIGHPNYGHIAIMPDATRNALAGDFD